MEISKKEEMVYNQLVRQSILISEANHIKLSNIPEKNRLNIFKLLTLSPSGPHLIVSSVNKDIHKGLIYVNSKHLLFFFMSLKHS